MSSGRSAGRRGGRRGKARLTASKKRYLIKDEKKAVRTYRRLGYARLARDEARHARFIKRQKVTGR